MLLEMDKLGLIDSGDYVIVYAEMSSNHYDKSFDPYSDAAKLRYFKCVSVVQKKTYRTFVTY